MPNLIEEAEALATTLAEATCIMDSEDGREFCGSCSGCRQMEASGMIARLLRRTEPYSFRDDEARAISLAQGTLEGHPQGKDMPDLAIAWLANRAELHARAVLHFANLMVQPAPQMVTPEIISAITLAKAELDALWSYFGKNLEVANWHHNGTLEPLDAFFDDNNHRAREALDLAIEQVTPKEMEDA